MNITSRLTRVPHVIVLALPTMTANSTSGSSSVFKDGKLKPGVYKIQNLYHQNYLDVQEHSRQLWGYPAGDLEEGRGLVSLDLPFKVRVSDN